MCQDGTYNSSHFPTAESASSSSMFDADGAIDGLVITRSGNAFTIIMTDAALDSIPGATASSAGGTFRTELRVGFAELLPVLSLDFFDAVSYEAKVVLQKTTSASFSSASASSYESSALRFANARVHKVHVGQDAARFYVAVVFVLGSESISAFRVPPESILVRNGGSNQGVDVECSPPGDFADFTSACGPFHTEPTSPFCNGTLRAVADGGSLASLYISLATAPDGESLVVEFAVTVTSGGSSTLEMVQLSITNLMNGFVEWCTEDESSSIDLVSAINLDVSFFSGVVLPESIGLSSLTPLTNTASQDSVLPQPQPTIIDGVITVSVSHEETADYKVELVKLATVYISDPTDDENLGSYLQVPGATYSPATGQVVMDTSGVCKSLDSEVCEVKVVVLADKVQQDADGDGRARRCWQCTLPRGARLASG